LSTLRVYPHPTSSFPAPSPPPSPPPLTSPTHTCVPPGSRYSKLELAKQKAIKELEEEYGRPIDEILEYSDDEETKNTPKSRQDEVVDEEEMLGESEARPQHEPEDFDEYTDPNAEADPYSYEGIDFSDAESGSSDGAQSS
jgi:hypothetical protein